MSYVDYSSNWVIDQFFTFLQANQLGSNDKHIVDNFSVEHNWNASTADGTHKTNSIKGTYIDKSTWSAGSQAVSAASSWVPTVGIYQIVKTVDAEAIGTYLEIYSGGAWRTPINVVNAQGLFFCDGSNMRFTNTNTINSVTLHFQKF